MANLPGPIDPATFSTALLMALLHLIDELKRTEAINPERYSAGLHSLADRMAEHQTSTPGEIPFNSLSGILGMIANHATPKAKDNE